ncbi:ribose-5-phosphate isomerase [Candidatus Daviesbacteria bacterium RIFCSPHIGHO2_12_FULL_37_11]|uniref:Ribose-5-phosphate isomerase B n=1 Tax=Candidatus Daviesbacteria bacterium RIFCSPHIGHO2_12_FULL_37_11 TaxID=1797777 RepID=A0A1F5K8Q6_9BACT|nr:MAG: ribose-5-phosphate isomerase [Candidatus Daviesbacteria bacterium RIFCSPHIGHO2_01_FULL_37_27]OGE37289.1 MAG: ribose-5-phosphate isomerase [Candidatus Daviesbacteria bacterium RIFCSPHIGHO2_12_FULL_37_11]OGE46040.1 MAG: ribose-5-phosphate isomerase [Candidatus Daviesbacteria bacterium RIFCSPLOWO2_01_FULL_37_10]
MYNGNMVIYIGADHGGFELKEQIKSWLSQNSYEVEDFGADSLNPEDDYPDFIILVAEKVVLNSKSLGIVIGRSGNGEAIAANKVKGIRAAVCLNVEMAEKAKEHNNANILSLGADYIQREEAEEIVRTFLDTPFSNEERHMRRLDKIEALENS